MVEVHLNQIGGERRPALSGAVFEVSAAGSSRAKARPNPLGAWPRSSAADVAAATESARARAETWRSIDAPQRRAILERAAVELSREPDPGGLLAARLGLERSELDPHLAAIPGTLDAALRDPAAAFESPRAAEPGLLLLLPAWSELVVPVAEALFSAFALGRSVILLSDPHAPMIADALAAALERGGLPPGVLSVVHDDGEDALRAALRSGAASYVRASGYPSRIRRLERITARSGGADFGAGLALSNGPAVELGILRCKTAVVRSSENPASLAIEVVDRAFGRSRSLSGQLPGQIGRVVCPERSFSRFTEALLAELRRSRDVAQPAPIVERESEDRLRRARILGLDEGATLIFDGEDLPTAGNGDPARSPAAPSTSGEAILAPTVFTNVEERMRLTLLGRPLPLLCLLRVPNDEQALSLAERLDREVPAEDLSLDASE